jgi:hypothetical protein
VIIPDASPVITLARIDRLDLFETFTAPIRVVDQVGYEVTTPANDPDGRLAAWLARMGNRIAVVETFVGFGFRPKLDRGEIPKGGNLARIIAVGAALCRQQPQDVRLEFTDRRGTALRCAPRGAARPRVHPCAMPW